MNISWFKPWMPLEECPYEAKELGNGVFKLCNQLYALTMPYNENYEQGEDAPYVTLLVMAGSEGAALRNLCSNSSLDDGASIDLGSLPDLGLGPLNYGFAQRLKDAFESASYDNDGKFIEVSIAVGSFELCYRSNKVKDHGAPYAIVVRNAI